MPRSESAMRIPMPDEEVTETRVYKPKIANELSESGKLNLLISEIDDEIEALNKLEAGSPEAHQLDEAIRAKVVTWVRETNRNYPGATVANLMEEARARDYDRFIGEKDVSDLILPLADETIIDTGADQGKTLDAMTKAAAVREKAFTAAATESVLNVRDLQAMIAAGNDPDIIAAQAKRWLESRLAENPGDTVQNVLKDVREFGLSDYLPEQAVRAIADWNPSPQRTKERIVEATPTYEGDIEKAPPESLWSKIQGWFSKTPR